jgi:hypothetical protein
VAKKLINRDDKIKAKINNILIKKLSTEDREYEVHDTDLKGFIIRVFPSGTMRYICQYQRGKKVNIGTVGVISTAQAREKAVEIFNNLHKGIEPKSKRGANKPKTLEELIEKEYKPWVLSHHKRGEETLGTLKRCFNKLYSKPITEITPSILEQWCTKRLNDGISTVTLNRNIATLKSVMTKATEWGIFKRKPFKNVKTI